MNLSEMTHDQFMRLLKIQGACPDAVEWCSKHGGTPEEMWNDCTRGDWLGWFIRQNLVDLGYDLRDWASALSEAIKDGDFSEKALSSTLKEYARGGDIERAQLDGWIYGLTPDLNIPMGRWLFLAESDAVFKRHFPIFEKEIKHEQE